MDERDLAEVPDHLRPLLLAAARGGPPPEITWPERVFRRIGPHPGHAAATIAVETPLPGGGTRYMTGRLPLGCAPQAAELAFAQLEATLTAALNGLELIDLAHRFDPKKGSA